jgi:hypothetical protein
VKRWSIEPTPESGMLTLEKPDGRWVRYEDAAALKAELDAMHEWRWRTSRALMEISRSPVVVKDDH